MFRKYLRSILGGLVSIQYGYGIMVKVSMLHMYRQYQTSISAISAIDDISRNICQYYRICQYYKVNIVLGTSRPVNILLIYIRIDKYLKLWFRIFRPRHP